ncbi:MAG: hypothetical protein ACOC7J_00560 [Armatimonadota bacterium]
MATTALGDKVATLEKRVERLERQLAEEDHARVRAGRISAKVLATMGYESWEAAREELTGGTEGYPTLRRVLEDMSEEEFRDFMGEE